MAMTLPSPVATMPDIPATLERAIDDQRLRQLLVLAGRRPELAWTGDRDIAQARSAHATNSPAELARALRQGFDWLEGDVRTDRKGRIIMAHNPGAPNFLTLDEWLCVGVRTGRGLKLDFKESAAIVPAVQRAAQLGIPASRFIINVSVIGDRASVITLEQLRAVRALYPEAIINISADVSHYCDPTVERMSRWARAAAQPTMFPLRHDLVTAGLVDRVRPFGRVAIWNEPTIAAPSCLHTATRWLRDLGVDGMIDLRRPHRSERLVQPLAWLSIRLLGWQGTLTVRRAATQARLLRLKSLRNRLART